MPGRLRCEIIFDDSVALHFAALDRIDRDCVLDAIEQQLEHEANIRTRNRKPLRIPNSLDATWELRCGKGNRFRVFYDVDFENGVVIILAVGRKIGSRLVIGAEELTL